MPLCIDGCVHLRVFHVMFTTTKHMLCHLCFFYTFFMIETNILSITYFCDIIAMTLSAFLKRTSHLLLQLFKECYFGKFPRIGSRNIQGWRGVTPYYMVINI